MCLICKGLAGYTVTRAHGAMECGRLAVGSRERNERRAYWARLGSEDAQDSRCKTPNLNPKYSLFL